MIRVCSKTKYKFEFALYASFACFRHVCYKFMPFPGLGIFFVVFVYLVLFAVWHENVGAETHMN